MTTKLAAPLRRELTIDDKPYVLTITSDGFKLVQKGRRKGRELAWRDSLAETIRRSTDGTAEQDRHAERGPT